MTERLTKLVNGVRIEMTAEEAASWVSKQPTATQLAEQRLLAWRETRTIPRTVFCQNAFRLGLLPMNEAIAACEGGWPATFDVGIVGRTDEEVGYAKMEWAGAANIRRNAPLLIRLAERKNVPDAVLDQLCGWTG